MGFFLTLFLALTEVKDKGASLRTSCTNDAKVLQALPGGTPVTIRYSVAGQGVPCYKVVAETEAGKVEGYLSADSLASTEEFDAARKEASWIDTSEMIAAALPPTPLGIAAAGTSVLTEASDLIQGSRPTKALELLENELKEHTDANLLAMAGTAAWRADNPRKALQYWAASLEMQPNPGLEALYKRIQREAFADRSSARMSGSRVVLRYEGASMSPDAARSITDLVDNEFLRLSEQLGCRTTDRVAVIVQSLDAYRKTTNTPEWNGGQFDGRIRVPAAGDLDPSLRRRLTHEIAHACIERTGNWPAWLHEGLAQYYSGARSSPADRSALAELARRKQLPKLTALGPEWSSPDTATAHRAYSLALVAVETFHREHASFPVRNLLKNPEKLAQITAELDRKLAQGIVP